MVAPVAFEEDTGDEDGSFIAVVYWPAPHVKLEALPLEVSEQMSPLHVPIGVTGRAGHTWLSIPEMDSIIVGGVTHSF